MELGDIESTRPQLRNKRYPIFLDQGSWGRVVYMAVHLGILHTCGFNHRRRTHVLLFAVAFHGKWYLKEL